MDAKLAEIKARCEAATPGPWYADGWALWDDDHGEFVELHDTDPDAQFIAHARSDIPALLAEAERLQSVEKSAKRIDEENRRLIIERDGLKEDNATLKRALELVTKEVVTMLHNLSAIGVIKITVDGKPEALADYFIQPAQEQEEKK